MHSVYKYLDRTSQRTQSF